MDQRKLYLHKDEGKVRAGVRLRNSLLVMSFAGPSTIVDPAMLFLPSTCGGSECSNI